MSVCHPVCSMSVSSLKNVQCLRFFPNQNLSRLICLVGDFSEKIWWRLSVLSVSVCYGAVFRILRKKSLSFFL